MDDIQFIGRDNLKLTKSERVIRTLNCEETDRPPIYDLIRNDAAIEYFAGGKFSQDNPEELTFKTYSIVVDATKQYIRLPHAEGQEIQNDGKEIVHRRWTSWQAKHDEYSKEKWIEKVKKVMKDNTGWTGEDEKNLTSYIQDLKYKQAKLGDTIVFLVGSMGGVYTLANILEGFDKFAYLLMDAPGLVSEALEILFQKNLNFALHLPDKALSPAVLIGEDIAFKSGPVFSPKYLKSEFMPRLKKITEVYHGKGYKVIFHSDGNLWEIMDDLVDCGIDGLNPIETLAGMDIKAIRDRYPNLILVGGIDCSQLLPYGTPEEVSIATRQAIADARYGYFVGSSSELHMEVPLRNILAMLKTVWKESANECQ